MTTLKQRMEDIENFQAEFLAGMYPQRPAIGPNTLSKTAIKSKSITSGMISVTNLQSVSAKTGSLTVDGSVTIGSSGFISAGKASYDDTAAGFFLGKDGATDKFNIGNASQFIKWDGSALSLTGTLSATSGTIGGWEIGVLDLTSSTGTVGLASAGTYRIWVGHATPSSAPFSVQSSGLMKATSGTIGGWNINGITGIYLGSGGTTRGMDTGSIAFFAGSSSPASAPFRVSTSGQLTATNINVTGGTVAGSTVGSGVAAGNITTGTLSADRIGASSITATKLSVSTLSSISANVGTINAGTIDASAMNIISLNAGSITVGTLVADRISGGNLGGGFGLGSSSVSLNSTGKIQWKSSASFIDNNEIFLDTTGSTDPAISLTRLGTVYAEFSVLSTGTFLISNPQATQSTLQLGSASALSIFSRGTQSVILDGAGEVRIVNGVTGSTGKISLELAGTGGSEAVVVEDGSNNDIFKIASQGAILTNQTATNTNTPSGATAAQLPIRNIAGTIIGYVPLYGSPW